MQATRIGDVTSGVCDLGLPCCPHGRTGTNSEGSPNVFINRLIGSVTVAALRALTADFFSRSKQAKPFSSTDAA